jgi:hypothetical protein
MVGTSRNSGGDLHTKGKARVSGIRVGQRVWDGTLRGGLDAPCPALGGGSFWFMMGQWTARSRQRRTLAFRRLASCFSPCLWESHCWRLHYLFERRSRNRCTRACLFLELQRFLQRLRCPSCFPWSTWWRSDRRAVEIRLCSDHHTCLALGGGLFWCGCLAIPSLIGLTIDARRFPMLFGPLRRNELRENLLHVGSNGIDF